MTTLFKPLHGLRVRDLFTNKKHLYLLHLWTNRRTHLQRRRESWRRWGCRDGRGMGFSPYFKIHCSCPSNNSARKLHFITITILSTFENWHCCLDIHIFHCLLCWCCDYRPACDLGQTCLNLFQVNSSAGLDLIYAVFILPFFLFPNIWSMILLIKFCVYYKSTFSSIKLFYTLG